MGTKNETSNDRTGLTREIHTHLLHFRTVSYAISRLPRSDTPHCRCSSEALAADKS